MNTILKNFISEWLILHGRKAWVRAAAYLLYVLWLQAFVWHLKRVRKITRIFLRRGFSRSDWIPGASDFDLTVITEDDAPIGIVKEIYHRRRSFKQLCPIPVDIEILTEAELQIYLADGNARALEAAAGWKLLSGRGPLTPVARPAAEVALHSFSEALDQYFRLVTQVLSGAANRRQTRDLIKYFSDAVFYCDLARSGKFELPPDRPLGIRSLLKNEKEMDLYRELLSCARSGFPVLPETTPWEMCSVVLNCIHQSSGSFFLKTVSPAWKRIPPQKITEPVKAFQSTWQFTASELKQCPGFIALHFLNSVSVVLAPDSINSKALALAMQCLKNFNRYPQALPVTEDVLRVLSNTFFHRRKSPLQQGVRFSWNDRWEGEWYEYVDTPEMQVTRRAIESTSPYELRLGLREQMDRTPNSPRDLPQTLGHAG